MLPAIKNNNQPVLIRGMSLMRYEENQINFEGKSQKLFISFDSSNKNSSHVYFSLIQIFSPCYLILFYICLCLLLHFVAIKICYVL